MAFSPKLSPSPSAYDSDGYFADGLREMTDKEEMEYYLAFEKTQGFDMPTFPESYSMGRIEPVSERRLFSPELQECAEEAIQHYNKENGTSFEFVKVVKANNGAVCGILYYITFEVKQIGSPPHSPTTTFQAQVLFGIDGIEVELCRPRPST